MEASFDQSTSDMFKLLSSLHKKKIPSRNFDSIALPLAEITDPNGVVVGEVPKNKKGLYRVEHYAGSANVTMEELTSGKVEIPM